MTSDMEGSKQALSKQWPDKPSLKYVDFIFVIVFEKGIFQNIQPKAEKTPLKFSIKFVSTSIFGVVNHSVSFQCTLNSNSRLFFYMSDYISETRKSRS